MTPCTIDDVKSYDSPKIYKRHDGWPPLEHAKGHVIAELRAQNAALLAENKRLQDNYDTALGACVEARKEILALREALTLTPEKVEAAAEAAYNQFFDVGDWQDSPQNAEHACWRGVGSAALLAAGMEAQP